MSSIRRRLLWTLLLGIGALLCAAAVGVYAEILDEVGELFDAQLQQAAYAFPRLVAPEPASATAPGSDDDNPLEQLVVEVRQPGSDVPVYHSRAHALLPSDAAPGWSTVAIADRDWRVYRVDFDGRSVEVAQPLAVRREVADEIAVQLLLPLLIALPMAALLIWLGVGRGLRPLERTAGDVQRRSPRDLSPLPVTALPQELTPLTTALNELMARLDRALKARKDFVADAAHELLTPLTAVQLQIQLLERAGDGTQRAGAQMELRAGLARAIHLARQLLTLARQDPEVAIPDEPVDLVALAREVAGAHAALARARGVNLGLARVVPAVTAGDSHGLRILLGNLVDNAIKYTPAGGRVDVGVLGDDTGAALRVEDSGPGIPPADLERVFDRFYRRPGEEATGSGLGLAIARKIAARHGAVLTLANGGALGGVVAECRFPPAR